MTYIKAISKPKRMGALAFHHMELGFSKVVGGMLPRNAYELPADDMVAYMKKKKITSKKIEAYFKKVSQKHLRVFQVKDVEFGGKYKHYNFYCLLGQSEEDALHANGENDGTTIIIVIVVGGGDGGGDDGGGDETPAFKDCSFDVCMIRGDDAACETQTVSVPENEDCPDPNSGCGGACGGLPGADDILEPAQVLAM